MMPAAPPLPPGFKLDQPSNGALPPLPPGFKLDTEQVDPSAGGGTLSIGPFDTGIKTPQWLDRGLAGAGKAFVDLGRGAGQYLGLESRGDVAESRKLDAPLMKTAAGRIGNVAGNIAATLPTLAIPGANTVAGAGLIGAGLGALQPSTSTKETLLNTGIGAATSAGGQWLGNKISSAATQGMANRAQVAAETEALNAPRDAVAKAWQAEGGVIPPTAVNPSATATAVESLAGKAATRQGAETINQQVTNKLIRQDLGLATDQPITRQALTAVRAKAGQVYQQVAGALGQIKTDGQFQKEIAGLTQVGANLEKEAPGIGAQAGEKVRELADSLFQSDFSGDGAIGLFKFLNNRAKASFESAFAHGNPDTLELARAQRAAADAIGDLIERNLPSDMASSWTQARKLIAQSYTAEAALKGSNVNAINLAAQFRKGRPLSGGFEKVAKFADQFGEAARVPKSGVGVSKLGAVLTEGQLLGAAGALMHGNIPLAAGLAGSAAVGAAAPAMARSAILSRAGQAMLATPSYAPNALGTAGLNALRLTGRYGALPAYMGTNALVQVAQ